jgi:anti-sigma regulatory factor (Ser/Thr protein kinase)
MAKKVIQVHHAIDAAVAHHAAKEVAVLVGFDELESEEIALAVSELASNQLKHAQRGTIVIESILGERSGVRVEAVDAGSGIADIEAAFSDGFSTAGSLGLGLGSVNRLMDDLDIQTEPGQGTRITCQRWLRPKPQAVIESLLEIGVATRPLSGVGVNGDAFVVKQWPGHALVGVIDGLGHGQYANLAAEKARQYVETHADQPLAALFRGTARACLATRGVVMALASFYTMGSSTGINFSFASIGNIEVRLLGSPEPAFFNLRRGVVGANVPNVVVTEHTWTQGELLILHSDGLTSHWDPIDYPILFTSPASQAAQELLTHLAKEDDDATIMVIKAVRKDRTR